MPYKDPEKARAYQREYRRLRRGGDTRTTPGTTLVPTDFRLQTAQDVIDLLAEQIAAVRREQEAGALEKARCIAYLAGISLKAIEAGSITARIEALEGVLSQRKRRNGKQ